MLRHDFVGMRGQWSIDYGMRSHGHIPIPPTHIFLRHIYYVNECQSTPSDLMNEYVKITLILIGWLSWGFVYSWAGREQIA